MSGAIPTLVVDDEPLARKRVVRLLRGDPDINIVGTFSSATEAAAQARELAPQLMLLDIRMPELDGFELVATLAEQGLNPYVIFVTAYADRFHQSSRRRTRRAAAVPGRRPPAPAALRARQGRGTGDARHRVRPGGGQTRENLRRRTLLFVPSVSRAAREPPRSGVVRAGAPLDARQRRAYRRDASAVSRRLRVDTEAWHTPDAQPALSESPGAVSPAVALSPAAAARRYGCGRCPAARVRASAVRASRQCCGA